MSALVVSHIVLWIIVIGQAVLILALTRQLGVLHERIAPAGALVLGRGLKVGQPVPVIEALNLAGELLRVGSPSQDKKSTLVLFVSPTCPICKSLLPVVKSASRHEREWLKFVLAGDGDLETHRKFTREYGLDEGSFVVSEQLGIGFQVNKLPTAALIDADGTLRARGLINSREHLESLFEAKRTGFASIQEYFERSAAVTSDSIT